MHTEDLNTALAGRYAIDRLIGEGGMATVYLARDVRHQRKVALKVLRPDLGAVLGVDRFLSEIQVTANLQHPNLLPLFDSGAANSLLFYVMPFVEGESLRSRLDREKQLPVDEAIRIATAVASALDYAHRQGVIHRDLKPENILLHEGQPLVADFGIALAVSNAGGTRITQTGLSLGTPQYMSPEQATGDRAIDGRTDIYSLGALTYEMLTGDAPHTGSTSQAIIARLLTERPRSIRAARSAVPEHVEAAVERALEKLPADRWATAKEYAEALSGARAVSRTTSATVPSAAAPTKAKPNASELAAWGLAAAAIVVAAAVVLRPDPPVLTGTPVMFELVVPSGMELTPVGNQASLALDTAGTTLVFQARDSTTGDDPALFLRRLDDPAIVKIRGTEKARSPILSPDGSEVLFNPPSTGGVSSGLRVALRGGTPRSFIDSTASNGQVSWIDDKLILLARDSALWTMPAAGGTRTLLAKPDSSRGHLRYGFPSLLPGGKAAVIAIWKNRQSLDAIELGVVELPSGVVTELAVAGTYPRYSATGHLLYVTADGVLMAAPFDVRSRRPTATALVVAEGVRVGTGGAAALAVAANGTIAWLGGGAEQGTWRLVAVSRTGVERVFAIAPGFFHFPKLSPDGKQVALTVAARAGPVGGTGVAADIWRADLTSNALLRITADSSSFRATWDTDGERLVYIKATGTTGSGIPLVRHLYRTAEATPLTGLSGGASGVSIGPTPGYSALIVDTTNVQADVWLVHSDSMDKPRSFLAQPYREVSPRVSPDGRWLAYVSDRTGRNEVYIQPIPRGGDEIPVSLDGGSDPVWARSGKELFYKTTRHLVSATLATGSRLQVVRRDTLFVIAGRFRNGGTPTYDVFPGDREFLMLSQGDVGTVFPLMVMTNWHTRSGSVQRR